LMARTSDAIMMINEFNYSDRSKSGYDTYNIIVTQSRWVCLCPDHACRDLKCMHVYAIEIYRRQNPTF
jgi:putative transposase